MSVFSFDLCLSSVLSPVVPHEVRRKIFERQQHFVSSRTTTGPRRRSTGWFVDCCWLMFLLSAQIRQHERWAGCWCQVPPPTDVAVYNRDLSCCGRRRWSGFTMIWSHLSRGWGRPECRRSVRFTERSRQSNPNVCFVRLRVCPKRCLPARHHRLIFAASSVNPTHTRKFGPENDCVSS